MSLFRMQTRMVSFLPEWRLLRILMTARSPLDVYQWYSIAVGGRRWRLVPRLSLAKKRLLCLEGWQRGLGVCASACLGLDNSYLNVR